MRVVVVNHRYSAFKVAKRNYLRYVTYLRDPRLAYATDESTNTNPTLS
jgi:hypothetical protein